MKRLLAFALVALGLLSATASSSAPARALVISPRRIVNGDDFGPKKQARDAQQYLQTLGCYYDVAAPENITTMDALVGTWHPSGTQSGDSLRYDVVIHCEYFNAVDTGYPGVNRDSLTRYSVWTPAQNARRAIHIFLGPPGISGYTTAAYGPVANCSTGVKTYSQAFLNDAAQGKTIYVPGKPYRWRSGTGMADGSDRPKPVALQTDGTIGGILRSVVAMRTNVAASDGTSPAAANLHRGVLCDDCDSLVAGEGAFADTALVWARYMIDGGVATKNPNIFVQYATGNGFGSGQQAVALPGIAFAMADSLLGNRFIGQKPGWEQIKLSLVLQGAGARSVVGAGSMASGNAANICLADSARYKPVVQDSIDKKLNIPFDMTFNADSAQAYLYEVNWYKSLKNAKFMPLPYTNFWNGPDGNTGKYRLQDPFGVSWNARTYGTYGATHSDDDTTVAGIWYNAFARIDSIFPGKVCYTIMPPKEFMIPSAVSFNGNMAGFPSVDSIAAALYWSKARTVIFNPDNVQNVYNTHYSVNGGNAFIAASVPGAWFTGEKRYKVWASTARSSPPVGSIFFAASGLSPAEGGEYNLNLQHDYANDFLQGVFYGNRLYNDYRFYYHSFRTPNHVMKIWVGSLHGEKASGSTYTAGVAGSSDWPRRWGWWMAKTAVYSTQAINYFAGRTVIRWVHSDEL